MTLINEYYIDIMKNRLSCILLMLFAVQSMMAQLTSLGLVEESELGSQWNSIRKGSFDYVPKFSFIDDNLYAATPTGLYRSKCASLGEWEKLPFTDELVIDFDVHGDTLIALSRESLFVSTDNGKTFKTISKAEIVGETAKSFTGLAVLPSDARVIYLTNESCLAISYDCGLQWTLAEGVHLRKIYHNPLVENSLVGFSRDLSDNCHYRYSTDGGYHWNDCKHIYVELGNISEIYDAAFHPTKVGRIIASGLGRYSISDDNGATWTHLAEPKRYDPIIFTTDVEYDKRNPDIVYATDWTSKSSKTLCIFRSTDGGYTWETFYEIDNPNGHALSISVKDNLLAIYSYAKGIYLLDVDKVASVSPVTGDAVLTPYYDLQGRPVTNPTRGIYIKDGKKVIIGQ